MKKNILIALSIIVLISPQLFGQTWSVLKRLTWNSGWSDLPSIACDSGSRIHVVWKDTTPGNTEIFYKHSVNGGATWTGFKRLSWNSGESVRPCIAVDSGNGVYVVWSDFTPGNWEVFYKNSLDSGATWSTLKRLTWTSSISSAPAIAVDSANRVYAIWGDNAPGNSEIFYKRSTNNGATWSTLKRLTWNTGWTVNPSIAADSGGRIHVVWQDNTLGNYELFYKSSTNGGGNWSALKRLTWNSGFSSIPSIAADSSGGVHVVWYDNTTGNNEIFYKRSTDNGASWLALTRFTWNSGESANPQISVDSGSGIHVVWEDSTPGQSEIFYKGSTNSGASWAVFKRLTWNATNSYYPAIASDLSNGIHIIWADYVSGNYEVFYKNRK